MLRFPEAKDRIHGHSPFAGTCFDDWVSAANVYEALQESCARHARQPAITLLAPAAPAQQVSYAELIANVARTANFLRSLGIQRKDVVAYLLPAMAETQYVLWGAETAGIACPVNFLMQPEYIAQVLRAAGARVLVAHGPAPDCDIWPKALAVRRLIPGLVLVKVRGQHASDGRVLSFDEAIAGHAPQLAFPDRPSRGDIAAYFHTGGTTGFPKLVAHTHENQLCAAYGGAAAVALTPDDVMTNGLPMFHVAGAIFCSLAQFMAGAQVLILSPSGYRNPSVIADIWRIVERHRVTILGAVPTALAAILRQPPGPADISSLRLVMSGAAALPRPVAELAERVTGRQVRELLGMTESGGVLATEAFWRERVLGSAGLPIPFIDMEARRMLEAGGLGDRCAPGEAGVLVARGPNITPGYLNPLQDAGAFTGDGWLITGDLGYLDASGRIFVTGRAKDVIIRGGHNIDPAMIEDAFLANPVVAAAAAVAMPDAYAGELPVVFVVLKPGHTASPAALLAFAIQRIHERPAHPKRIFLVDQLPLTAIGKIFKPDLRNACAEALFKALLADEAILSLSASEDARRGRMLSIHLGAAKPGRLPAQRRIEARLAPYGVTVVWHG
jgi:fatty-acyl-CoA synthase